MIGNSVEPVFVQWPTDSDPDAEQLSRNVCSMPDEDVDNGHYIEAKRLVRCILDQSENRLT